MMGLVNPWRVSGGSIFRGTMKNLIIRVDQGLPNSTTWAGVVMGAGTFDTCNLVTYKSVTFVVNRLLQILGHCPDSPNLVSSITTYNYN